MATNFEFYKDELSNVLAQREGRCIVMEVDDIMKRGFHRFCTGSDCGECWRKLFKYLAEEHIEAPKLTKRERAFCEAVKTGWIARDRDRSLCWFPDDAVVQKTGTMWNAEKYVCISHFKLPFICIKWEDEKPWSVADLLKLEVEE